MRILGFHHLAIQAHDLERMCAFYVEVLGLREQTRHFRADGSLRSVWLDLPGGGFLALEQVGGEPEAAPFRTERPGLFLLALRISADERARALERLSQRGVSIHHQTRWTVYFQDPEGNRVGLSHHPEDPVGDP